MSLDRLIDLAKKTGDRLIVHDRYGEHDFVILSVDSYEQLLQGKADLHDMSESQLLDQIDRDIAIWRANQQMDEDFAYVPAPWEMEDEKAEWEGPSPWSSTADVVGNRYSDWSSAEETLGCGVSDDSAFYNGSQNDSYDVGNSRIPDWPDWNKPKAEPKKSWDGDANLAERKHKGASDFTPAPSSVEPFQDSALGVSEAESLPDEPVFYEEPV